MASHNDTTDRKPHEKDVSSQSSGDLAGTITLDMADNLTSEGVMKHITTNGSISMSPEMFAKLYLAPERKVKGELRKTFANPTPLALLGLVMALSPFSCDIMGWRGAGGNGAASTGSYYWMGGLLMILGGIGEWILGNTFPFLVFCAYGGFWLSFGATLTPSIGAYGHYSTSYSTSDPSAGLDAPEFAASFAFFLLAMALLSFIFAVGTLRTNVCFAVIEWGLTLGFCLLTGTFWSLSAGRAAMASRCLTAAGAFCFVAAAGGWYILAALILDSVDFPLSLPVGDLSHLIKAKKRAIGADAASEAV